MCANFILLANGTAGNKVVDEDRKSRPPEVTFNDSLGAKSPEMARERRGMDRVKERGTGGRWYIHPTLVVEVSVVKNPVSEGRTWKKGCIIRQVLNGTKYKGVSGGRRLNVAGEGEIEGVNYGGFGDNGGVIIVEGSVDLVIVRESVGRSKFSARKDFPDDVKVL